ncbi:S-layer protein [Kribbella sp. NPDC056951]|uniref:S-layer protein n=1 Tax=Kribbella sp. NPDC056951 TaxID=3345978 RepID=UPI003637D3CD
MESEGQHRMLIGGVVLVVVVVVLGSFLIFRDKGATMQVTAIPNDLTLTLDGRQVDASGEIKVSSGRHTLVGERRGFQPYSTTFTAESGDEMKLKMYLYANSAEGRDWTRKNPEAERELEAEAGRNFDEGQRRIVARYPIIQQLPHLGRGYKVDYTTSKSDPQNPEALSIRIATYTADGKDNALYWITSNGWNPDALDIIYTTIK